jgi:hypothetical protein
MPKYPWAVAAVALALGTAPDRLGGTDEVPSMCDEWLGSLPSSPPGPLVTVHKFGESGACYVGYPKPKHTTVEAGYCHGTAHPHRACEY